MLGAIIGDIIGSPYEHHPIKSEIFEIFVPTSKYTDDTVLTIAIADALLSGADYCEKMRNYALNDPHRGYGSNFKKWVLNNEPNNSFGNGSAMRVSPVGWFFDDTQSVLNEAKKTALCTHNHLEGIKGAQAVALSVYLAKIGKSKEYIKNAIIKEFYYNLNRTIESIRTDYTFDVTCLGSVPEAIIAFLDSNDYESAVRKAVSLGGDADTQAAIAGSIAEAYYKKIPESFIRKALGMLRREYIDVIFSFYENISKKYDLSYIRNACKLIESVRG